MKVLIATDGSPCSEHAVREAARLLPLSTSEVRIVSVTPFFPVATDPIGLYGLSEGPMIADAMAAAQRHVDEAATLLGPACAPTTEVRQGDAAGAILEAATEMHPDVIVLGTHGRGPLGRMLLGSVSDAVLHRWPGATMVIHPKPEQAT